MWSSGYLSKAKTPLQHNLDYITAIADFHPVTHFRLRATVSSHGKFVTNIKPKLKAQHFSNYFAFKTARLNTKRFEFNAMHWRQSKTIKKNTPLLIGLQSIAGNLKSEVCKVSVEICMGITGCKSIWIID